MFCVKQITEEDGSLSYEVNKMLSFEDHQPVKKFTTREEAHNYVLSLIEEFKNSLNKSWLYSIFLHNIVMMKIKQFVTDLISTFFLFAYEGLIIASYIISETINSIVKFIKGLLIPFLMDLLSDIVVISHALYYEFLYYSSVLCLKISQILSNLSDYLLSKAEENSHKKAW